MEESLSHFLIGVLVPGRVVKRTKQFLTSTLFNTAPYQLAQENAHRIVIGNRVPMRMLSHDCYLPVENYIRKVQVIVSPSQPVAGSL